MQLTVLGSGTAVPHPLRSSAGFWLQTASGTLLLDIAASVPQRMVQERLDWANLDAVWISHFHIDHCSGIAPFLFATRGAPETKDRKKPLRIFGAAGLRKLVQAFDDIARGKLLDQPFPLEIIEVEPLEKFEILTGIEATALATPHTPESRAIHLREGDTTFVYTADTGFDEMLATFARKVDLLLIESSFVKDKKTEKHLELSEAMHLVRRAEPGRAMLIHMYAEWDSVDFQAEVKKFSPGCEVIEAVDGLRMEVGKVKARKVKSKK
jgi:ribonuclease BN (tRNA processing enzyme)